MSNTSALDRPMNINLSVGVWLRLILVVLVGGALQVAFFSWRVSAVVTRYEMTTAQQQQTIDKLLSRADMLEVSVNQTRVDNAAQVQTLKDSINVSLLRIVADVGEIKGQLQQRPSQ